MIILITKVMHAEQDMEDSVYLKTEQVLGSNEEPLHLDPANDPSTPQSSSSNAAHDIRIMVR